MSDSIEIEAQEIAYIGSLYNSETKRFLKGVHLFDFSKLPDKYKKKTDIKRIINYTQSESKNTQISDRIGLETGSGGKSFTSLFSGCAGFQFKRKQIKNPQKHSLTHKLITVSESVNLAQPDLKDHLFLGALNFNSSHVLVGIEWGVCLNATFSYMDKKDENLKKIIAGLGTSLPLRLFKIPIDFKAEREMDRKDSREEFKLNFHADIIDRVPTNLGEFSQLINDVPNKLHNCNEGKGKPLSYTLMPVTDIKIILGSNLLSNEESVRMEISNHTKPSQSIGTISKTSGYNTEDAKRLSLASKKTKYCFSCGDLYPHEGECPAKNKKCGACGRYGHYKEYCRLRSNFEDKFNVNIHGSERRR